MPTGYTYLIQESVSFDKFLMNCAKAFGACVSMRDDPSNKEIPEKFEPSDYHIQAIEKTKRKLKELVFAQYDDIKLNKKAEEEFKKEQRRINNSIKKKRGIKRKYKQMLSKVKKWQPPTPDHQKLKEFMMQQINDSMPFDCDEKYDLKNLEILTFLTGQQWLEKECNQLFEDLDYHMEKDQKERERVTENNKWIKQLRESL